jgi:hypothetical protein
MDWTDLWHWNLARSLNTCCLCTIETWGQLFLSLAADPQKPSLSEVGRFACLVGRALKARQHKMIALCLQEDDIDQRRHILHADYSGYPGGSSQIWDVTILYAEFSAMNRQGW